MAYRLNGASLDLIKRFEGWRSKAYQDTGGVWTIGYGHTSAAGHPKVVKGLRISKVEGEALLQKDMQQYAKAVDDAVHVDLNANQFGALVSFCYNVGPSGFRRSSVLKRVNARRFNEVPGRLALWNKDNGRVLRGLTRRRKAEGELFLTPPILVANKPASDEIEKSLNDADKPLGKSTTFWRNLVSGVLAPVLAVVSDPKVQALIVLSIVGLVVWNIYDRKRKANLARAAKISHAEAS